MTGLPIRPTDLLSWESLRKRIQGIHGSIHRIGSSKIWRSCLKACFHLSATSLSTMLPNADTFAYLQSVCGAEALPFLFTPFWEDPDRLSAVRILCLNASAASKSAIPGLFSPFWANETTLLDLRRTMSVAGLVPPELQAATIADKSKLSLLLGIKESFPSLANLVLPEIYSAFWENRETATGASGPCCLRPCFGTSASPAVCALLARRGSAVEAAN